MTFFEQLIIWDKQTLLTINSYHLPWLDRFMWLLSQTMLWLPVLFVFLVILFRNKGSKTFLLLLAIALLITLTDQISSSIIKPLVERFRPTHDPELGDWVTLVNGYKGGRFGFLSSHAANAFAFAGFSLLLFKNTPYTIFILLWASLVSFSRLYLGVHYPLDVISGALLGLTCSWGVYSLYNALFERQHHTGRRSRSMRNDKKTTGEFRSSDIYLLIGSLTFLLTTAVIASFELAW